MSTNHVLSSAVEGNDWLQESGCNKFEEKGITVGLMMTTFGNLWSTGKMVTMDSGFSVSKGILTMQMKGVLGKTLLSQEEKLGCFGKWEI